VFLVACDHRASSRPRAGAGPAGNGIGENNFIPPFLRLSPQLGKGAQIDLYAGLH